GCRCRWTSALEDADEDCRRLAAGASALYASPRSDLHDVADGDRSDFRNDLGAVRISEPHYRSAPIHDPGHSRYSERICADASRAKVFSTDKGCDARLGSALSPTSRRAERRRY